MAVDTAALRSPERDETRSRSSAAVSLAVAALAVVTVARVALAALRPVPVYFPDEYLYAALGRSLAHGHAAIRGQAAHFPALLQPLLTAPLWRVGSVETAYRLVQVLGSIAFTLAAIPTFVLARRVGLSRAAALATAAIALLVPDALYSAWVLAEPIAYPLVAAAALVGVAALARPTRTSQLLFIVLSALATATRVQFVALPLCYALAAGAIGLRERSLRRVLREQRLVALVLLLPVLLVLARGPSHVLGYYSSVLHPGAHPLQTAGSLGRNALVLAYASGWILVPGALLGLVLSVARPRSRVELAFGAFASSLVLVLLLEASLFGEPAKVQERYVFYVVPLLAIAFCLYGSRGWPLRRAHALLAAGLILLGATVTLAGWAQPTTADHSLFLHAVEWLERHLTAGTASVVTGGAAIGLAAVLLGLLLRPQRATAIVLAVAAAVCTASYAGAVAFDVVNTRLARAAFLPTRLSWVDAADVGPTTLVAAFNSMPSDLEEQLFWNRTVDRVAVLPASGPPDRMQWDALRFSRDGTLLTRTHALSGPVLLDRFGATAVLRHAQRVAFSPHLTLWRPRGEAQLALYMPGRYFDGWIAPHTDVLVWPRTARGHLTGRLELELGAPPDRALRLTVKGAGVHRSIAVPAGRTEQVRVPICSRGVQLLRLDAPAAAWIGTRIVAGRSNVPRFVPDASACRY
jgi:hypothetical protein